MSSASKGYAIVISDSARKSLRKIPKHYQRQIIQAAIELGSDPFPPGHKKLKPSSFYRIRIGVYRVIYDVQKGRLRILIVHIGHRQDVYLWLENK